MNKCEPTLLCRAYASLRLMEGGNYEVAEDELQAAFGKKVLRIKKDGRPLLKLVFDDDLTDQESVEMINAVMDGLAKLVRVERKGNE